MHLKSMTLAEMFCQWGFTGNCFQYPRPVIRHLFHFLLTQYKYNSGLRRPLCR